MRRRIEPVQDLFVADIPIEPRRLEGVEGPHPTQQLVEWDLVDAQSIEIASGQQERPFDPATTGGHRGRLPAPTETPCNQRYDPSEGRKG